MRNVPARLRRLVVGRCSNRCEYCHLSQVGQEATFYIDHFNPLARGGRTVTGNLALACVSCSLRKAARVTAVDPQTGAESPIFNPRQDNWSEHFYWDGLRLVGLTSAGRATVQALDLNRALILAIRQEEAVLGRLP